MALKLSRRHRLECEAGHPEDSRSGDWEERRRGWKRCNCGIHLSGTLGGKFSRKATGTADWAEARAVATAYEGANSWTGELKAQPAPPDPASEKPRVTIADACKVFLTSRNPRFGVRNVAEVPHLHQAGQPYADAEATSCSTRSRRRTSICSGRTGNWDRGEGQTANHAAGILPLLRESKVDSRVTREPQTSSRLWAPVAANKAPFTDDELHRIIEACDQVKVEWKNETGVASGQVRI